MVKGPPDGKICLPARFLSPFSLIYDLPQNAAHGLGGLLLLLPGSVGVGAQGEASVVVPQHGGHRFHVHAVLEGCGGEGVPEIRKLFITTKTKRKKKPGSYRKTKTL